MIAFESIMCVLYSTAARIVLLYLVYLSIHIHLQGYARECTLLYRLSLPASAGHRHRPPQLHPDSVRRIEGQMAATSKTVWANLTEAERQRKCTWFRDQLRLIEEKGGEGSLNVRLCILSQKEVAAQGVTEECRVTLEGEVALRLASRWAVFRNKARDRLAVEDLTAVLPMAGDSVLPRTPLLLVRAGKGSKSVDVGSLAGKVVFLVFWSTWCAASHAPLANAAAVARKHFGDGCDWPDTVAIVSVSLDDSLGAITRFLAQNRLEDPNHSVTHCWCGPKGWNGAAPLAFGVKSLPGALFLDEQLKVVWRGHPLRFNLEEEVQALLDRGLPGAGAGAADDEPERCQEAAGDDGGGMVTTTASSSGTASAAAIDE